MVAINFDRLNHVETLKNSGVSEAQARAHDNALDDAFKDSVATKQELMLFKSELKHDIQSLEMRIKDEFSKIKDDFSNIKAEIAVLKWMMGVMSAGIIALVVKAFFA